MESKRANTNSTDKINVDTILCPFETAMFVLKSCSGNCSHADLKNGKQKKINRNDSKIKAWGRKYVMLWLEMSKQISLK